MSDLIWYYARGETEKGPLSTAQVKALAAAGKIRPEDLVWREGMETWVPASEVPDLFPNGTAKSRDKEKRPDGDEALATQLPGTSLGVIPTSTWMPPRKLLRHVGRVLACAGFFTVLLTRGCEQLSERYVTRLQAEITIAEQQHRAEWNARQRRLDEEIMSLRAIPNRTPAQQEQLRALAAKPADLAAQAEESERHLRTIRWEPLQIAAETAEAENEITAFRHSAIVLAATILLACGLFTLGYTSDGIERSLSLAAVVVLLFAIFTGNAFT